MLKEPIVIHDWVSPIGGDWSYWLNFEKHISEFIRGNELSTTMNGMLSPENAKTARAIMNLEIRGGLKVPHLHFHDKIYLLNEEQWAKFSKEIIADCKSKLEKVKTVSFETGMMLSAVTHTMTKR
jgi:hypothetical protein